jgi:non-ribosomal peptide synthetase component F
VKRPGRGADFPVFDAGAKQERMMSDKAEAALAATLTRLQGATALTQAQADAVAREFTAEYTQPIERAERENPRWSSILGEVGGYIGSAFVVAAAIALVSPDWDHLSKPWRVGVQAGPALLLLICGVMLAATTPGGWSVNPVRRSGPRRRLVSVLTVAAGGLFAGAASVVAPECVLSRFFRWCCWPAVAAGISSAGA